MKPSELPKDGNFSGRINQEVKKILREQGITEQSIIDAYIDGLIKASIMVEWKRRKRKK